MTKLTATKLVEDMAFSKDTSSQMILTEVLKAQRQVGQRQLLIAIDSDDDFAVNGQSSFSQLYVVGDRDLVEVYKDAISSIRFGHPDHKNYKLESFLEMINSDYFLEDVASGYGSMGGNQTIDVRIVDAPTTMQFGSIEIDLTQ